MRIKTEWETWTVSFCPKVCLLQPSRQQYLPGHTGRVASLGKLHQVALINRSPGGARNLVAGSRLLQLSLVFHVHIGRRVSSHLASPEQGCFECCLNFFKGPFFVCFFLSPHHGFLFSPLCGFIKGFCQERVIGDPDLAEICSS
jgi:hypothetical protein